LKTASTGQIVGVGTGILFPKTILIPIGLNSQPNQICRNAPAGAGQRSGKELSGGRFELNHYFRDTLGQPLARAKVKGEL
jgi:hypothetical protein